MNCSKRSPPYPKFCVFSAISESMSTASPQHIISYANRSLSCVLDYGKSGIAPTSVTWGVGSLVKDTDYTETEMSKSDGQATSIITLTSPNNVKFALTYTCEFNYAEDEKYSMEITVTVRSEL